jgi:hypothetical protein
MRLYTLHLPFEVMYGFQPSTPADRLLPLASATTEAADRLTMMRDIRDVVYQLIKLSKERMAARTTRTAPLFHQDDNVYLSTKGLNLRSQKCKHLRDQRLGPFKVICKVGINSYKLLLPKGCRLHHVFHCDLVSHASSSTSLKPHQAEIEGDHEEYAVDFISYVKIDNWPRRRGSYLHFLTHFVSFDISEWLLLKQVDDCEQLSIFFSNEKWNIFSKGNEYLYFANKFPMRTIIVDK